MGKKNRIGEKEIEKRLEENGGVLREVMRHAAYESLFNIITMKEDPQDPATSVLAGGKDEGYFLKKVQHRLRFLLYCKVDRNGDCMNPETKQWYENYYGISDVESGLDNPPNGRGVSRGKDYSPEGRQSIEDLEGNVFSDI